MQDFRIFSLSVEDNILLKKSPTEEEKALASRALAQVGMAEKVKGLPHGADTVLTREFSEDGAVLSGGQYQRVAIARALARPGKVVVLDEPSSALDPIAEYEMYRTMLSSFVDRAVILISHRLSAASMMDKIYYLEDGAVLEEGTHQELLRKNGRYAAMWKVQAEQYQMEVDKDEKTALE